MIRALILILLPILWLSLSPSRVDKEAYYFSTTALSGDNASKLLQRYLLPDNSCNLNKFYELNKLTGRKTLMAGQKYQLPVLIYPYDGKSIRSTVGLKTGDWERALAIKQYNEQLQQAGKRKQSIVDSRILWAPHHLLHCKIPDEETAEKVVPPNQGGDRYYPIFGPKYAKIPKQSNRLAGKVFYLVAGHGGRDPGAIGHRAGHNLCEDEYAYDVCLRLCRKLLEYGAIPYMVIRDPDDGLRDEQYLTCDTDEYCWGDLKIPFSQKPRLSQRSQVINELYESNRKRGVTEQYLITMHVDSRSQRDRTDVFFYHHPSSEKGKLLAKKMQKALKSNYQKKAKRDYYGKVSGRDLHMVREVLPPAVFIELGNIRHPIDQLRLIEKSNRQLLADWLFEGILEW